MGGGGGHGEAMRVVLTYAGGVLGDVLRSLLDGVAGSVGAVCQQDVGNAVSMHCVDLETQ